MSRVAPFCHAALLTIALTADVLHASSRRLGGSGGEADVSVGRIVIAFVICIVIAVLAILLIRQRNGSLDFARLFARIESRARAIELVETRRLNPHTDICLVRHDEREYLLVLQSGATHVLRDRAIAVPETPA